MMKRTMVLIVCMLSLLNSVSVAQAESKPEQISKEVAEAWIVLLDAQKFAESWKALSPNARAKLSQQQWEIGMQRMRKSLGTLKSRKLAKVEFIQSLKGYPYQEGAIVTFDSSFEGRDSVKESVGTIHDKDGKWRVVAYVNNNT